MPKTIWGFQGVRARDPFLGPGSPYNKDDGILVSTDWGPRFMSQPPTGAVT